MRLLSHLSAIPLLALASLPGHAQQVRWTPERVTQGSVVRLELSPPDGTAAVLAVSGTLAGEPLHFERSGATFRALAAIPVDAPDTLAATLLLERSGAAPEPVAVRIPVAHGSFRMEHLTVAPRFGTEPDSALAARIAAEGRRAREIAERSHETPRLWRAPFRAPRPGAVTSPFGGGREFNGTVESRHMGTDFKGAVGAPVRAANRGVVALVDRFFLGGNVVYIDHGAGLVTGYLHLSRILVHPGDTVARGQVIGRVGSTGRVTGPHLHWTVRYGGITVDGMSLLRLTAPAPARAGEGAATKAGRHARE
jgi:murein DD-endopeptidase MepM/ murein hydrolase activator NlpD